VRIPTGLRSFLSLREVAQTISDMGKAISLGWGVDHRPDGTHKFSWVDVAHDATRYTGGGTMTWGVTSDDQKLLAYRIVGDTCEVQWRIERSDVGGGSTQLNIRLPDGIRPTKRSPGVHYYDDAGTEGIGLARLNAELTQINLYKYNSASNWTLTTSDNTWTEGTITFPITQ
jgi:hypothetical protein